MDRRGFLATSVSAAGISLAGAATAKDKPQDKTYRVGVIGSTGRGDYGHALDRAWLAIPETKIVAVADDNAGGRAAASKRLRVEATYSDYRKMLDEAKPDIVAICPRWLDQHRDMAVAAANRGMHIYMEKPFCRTLKEADEIVGACEKSGSKLLIAHPTRYSPKLATVKKLIADGKLGRVLEYRGRGKEDGRGSGQDLWVLGTHVMDLIRALAGHPKWCFARVLKYGKPVTKTDVFAGPEGIGPLAGNAVHAMYGLADGTVVHFNSVKDVGRGARYALQIFGSEGILEMIEGILPSVKYIRDKRWSPGRSGAKWQNVSSAGIGKPEPLTDPIYKARHTLQIRDLLAAIREDRQPAGGMYEARGATEMIVAVFESHRVGGPVKLPLTNRDNPLAML